MFISKERITFATDLTPFEFKYFQLVKKKILFFLFLVCQHILVAQTSKTLDSSFVNSFSTDFFGKNPVVDSIESYGGPHQLKHLSVYLKSPGPDSTIKQSGSKCVEYFDLNYFRDAYRFYTKYGELTIPEDRLGIVKELFRADLCSLYCFIKVVAKANSLRYVVTCYCPR